MNNDKSSHSKKSNYVYGCFIMAVEKHETFSQKRLSNNKPFAETGKYCRWIKTKIRAFEILESLCPTEI